MRFPWPCRDFFHDYVCTRASARWENIYTFLMFGRFFPSRYIRERDRNNLMQSLHLLRLSFPLILCFFFLPPAAAAAAASFFFIFTGLLLLLDSLVRTPFFPAYLMSSIRVPFIHTLTHDMHGVTALLTIGKRLTKQPRPLEASKYRSGIVLHSFFCKHSRDVNTYFMQIVGCP